MGCCSSSTECEERRKQESSSIRTRDCSEIVCCDDSPYSTYTGYTDYTGSMTYSPSPGEDGDADFKYVSEYDDLVRNASQKAKEIDENLENQYKNNYNSILYPREYYDAESVSPNTYYLSSDADVEPETYFCNRPRAYSESKIQPPSSISNSISGHLGRV